MKMIKFAALATTLILSGTLLADKTTGQVIDDSVIQSEVKAKLVGNDFWGGMSANIETRKGVVQLGGYVDDISEAVNATKIAASVEGVVEVDNQLHEKSGKRSMGQSVDDGITTTRVKGAIGDADLGSGFKINVDTYAGVVLLTGFVDTQEDKDLAGKLASEAKHVQKVINGVYVSD